MLLSPRPLFPFSFSWKEEMDHASLYFPLAYSSEQIVNLAGTATCLRGISFPISNLTVETSL
jgi:hypothetical protein